MTVETATHLDDLNPSYPAGTDSKSEGDDHIRLLKTVLQTDFPNITGAVTSTHTELNILDGVTATAAELNILDGVTATAAEINDACDHSAVTGFTLAHPYYIDDDGDSQGGDSFSISGLIGTSFESVGPTGSGATNIWTALDILPAAATYVELRIAISVYDPTGSTSTVYESAVQGRRTGSTAIGSEVQIAKAAIRGTGSATQTANIVTTRIPIDSSNRFDLKFDANGTSNTTAAYLVGFGV